MGQELSKPSVAGNHIAPMLSNSNNDVEKDSENEVGVEEINDLNRNLKAKIRNPLKGIPRKQLLADVEQFVRDKGLTGDLRLFQKGAIVAQDLSCINLPLADFNFINSTYSFGDFALNADEIESIRNEFLHKWQQPKALYRTLAICSISAAVQGWDQTGSNGANTAFPIVFGIGSDSVHDTLLLGLVNSAPYLAAAFLGCWISDPLNFHLGRRGTIFLSALFCFFPVIGSAFTQTWQQLLICRLLLGIGMGVKGSTVPIYAAENSPALIRGALLVSWQLWTAFGIFLGTCANLIVINTGKIAWRLQLGSAMLPAIPLMVCIFFCPESPRWYMKKGRYIKAYHSLLKLRNTPFQAARDLYYIHSQLEIEKRIAGDSNYITRFGQLFTIPRVRRATLASFTVMIAQQMCGINIIAFYSTTIFKNSGFDEIKALWASFLFGLFNFVFTFPAIFTIDRFGRRALLLFTFPNMAWSLLAVGLCARIKSHTTAHLATVAFFVYVFAMFYSPGEGPVPFTYSAEAFPLSHREVGMGWAVATCLFWASVLTLFLPLMLAAMGTSGVFYFYAGMNIVAFIMIFLFVPETKKHTLEELDYIFGVSTRSHIEYQVTKVLPHFFKSWKSWIFFQKAPDLEPLYSFDTTGRPPVGKVNEDGVKYEERFGSASGSGSSSAPEMSGAMWADGSGFDQEIAGPSWTGRTGTSKQLESISEFLSHE